MSKSMFEVYLNEVTDEGLRAKLKAEYERTTKNFGLVFERHSPEGIRMPNTPVRRGRTVIREADSTFHKVRSINSDALTIVDEQGNVTEENLANVTAARQFGEVVFPGLKTVGSVRTGNPKSPAHVVINGENFHALEMLGYTHRESVDLIYIDPPYNTGNKTWQYNDHYVAEQDSFRHSKWLSFIERRLTLARKLLKPTGIIIVAIGDEEHHRLRMLMDQVFGDNNFLANLVWDGGTKSYASFVSSGQDYMLVYSKNASSLADQGIQWRETKPDFSTVLNTAARLFESSDNDAELAGEQFRHWMKKSDLSPGIKRFNQIEAITGRVFNADRDLGAPEKRSNRSFKPLLHPVTGLECPVPSNGWRLSETELFARLTAGRIAFGTTESKIPREKSYLDEASTQIPGAFSNAIGVLLRFT